MNQFNSSVEVRWSDLDPNFHVRHSVYYDFAAVCRIRFLDFHGITAQFMHSHGVGLVIFREECVFKKEIQLSDKVTINIKLLKARKDASRWTLQHQIFKNDEILAAVITLEGAWIDLQKRKLAIPPPETKVLFEDGPKADNFQWEG